MKTRYTREQLKNNAIKYYGLEHPVTIAICEIDEAHPDDERYTAIMETLYVWGNSEDSEDEEEAYTTEDEDDDYLWEEYEEFWDAKIKEI